MIISNVYDNSLMNVSEANKAHRKQTAAEEVEALFVNQLLRAMDKTVTYAEDSLLHSRDEDMFRDLMYQEVAHTISRGEGIGLKDIIIEGMKERGESIGLSQRILVNRCVLLPCRTI